MSLRSFFPVPVLLFLIFFFGILFFLRSHPFNDPGALWHIRVGDLILESGLMHTDPFTWTFRDQKWIPQQWLAECGISWLHGVGGFDALLVALATLIATFGSWVACRFMRGGLHWTLALILTGIAITVAAFHFYIRPHMLTIGLMGVVMALIVDTENSGIRWKRWLWMIPLCVLWTNLHGGVLAGIATLGLAVLGWGLLFLFQRESPLRTWLSFLGLGVVTLLCLATIFVNPFGLEMQRTWFVIVGSTELPKHISEHKPIDWSQSNGFGVLGFGLFYLLMLAGIYPQRPKLSWLIPLLWFALACKSIRHGPLFCAVGVVSMADFFPHTFWFRWLKKHGDTLIREPDLTPIPRWQILTVPTLLILLSLVLQSAEARVPFIGKDWARLDPEGIPVELIPRLKEYASTRPKGYPIFNDANLGGFLIYFTPSLKIYFDDRCELYGDPGLAKYVDFFTLHPERIEELMQETPASTHFEMLLVSTETPMDDYLKTHPELVHEVQRSSKVVLFERVRKK